ncbi:MAG: class I SAM-dependent methyltransferase, partial [Microvirga sp.]
YDLEAFRANPDRLRPYEADELGPVEGLELVHLQCHIGLDTLSWARRGARVVGYDFSEPAVDVGRRLAAELGLDAEFVAGDVYDALERLGGRTFDVVYTGIGALSWLPDIDRWGEVVAALLRPGGVAYIVEIHPLLWVMDDAEPCVKWDYFAPLVSDDASGTYADRAAPTTNNRVFEHNPGIGGVVSALLAQGLTIELLHEHDIGVEQMWPFMVPGPTEGTWIIPPDQPNLPLTWSLKARNGPSAAHR